MTAIEALIYCLGYVDETTVEDGEYRSQTVYDRNGEAHWVAWVAAYGEDAEPRLCSGSPSQFTKRLEPYRLER